MPRARKPKVDVLPGRLPVDPDALTFTDERMEFSEDKLPEDKVPDVPQTAEEIMGQDMEKIGSMRAAMKREEERFQNATDSEYWLCLVFDSRAQKEAFLAAMKWLRFGDKMLDGCRVAELQGVTLPPADVPYVPEKPDAKLNDIALPLEKKRK